MSHSQALTSSNTHRLSIIGKMQGLLSPLLIDSCLMPSYSRHQKYLAPSDTTRGHCKAEKEYMEEKKSNRYVSFI